MDLGQLVVGAPLGGEASGEWIEGLTHFKEVDSFIGADRGDPGVPVRGELDEPFTCQSANCFPERSGAHPQLTGEFPLVDAGARGKFATEDQVRSWA